MLRSLPGGDQILFHCDIFYSAYIVVEGVDVERSENTIRLLPVHLVCQDLKYLIVVHLEDAEQWKDYLAVARMRRFF